MFPSPELWERPLSPVLPQGESKEIPSAEGLVWGRRGDGAALTQPGWENSRASSAPAAKQESWEDSPRYFPLPHQGRERAAGELSQRPQSRLWSSAIPGGGREGGRAQGGSASPLRAGRRGRHGESAPSSAWPRGNQEPGEKRLDGGEPPSLPRLPRGGSRSGAWARRRCPGKGRVRGGRPGHARGAGGTGMEIKTNPERTNG